mmetsp:Transcript_20717/g.39380  ORF Transcript_20717/g.39380 Transcript_20717/m.39380 type:complete len:236 (+) Transcript_20717:1707-2414(+)
MQQVVRHVSVLQEPHSLRRVEAGGLLQERLFENLWIHLQRREHAQQVLAQRTVHRLPEPFLLQQHEEPLHALLDNLRALLQVSAEELQTQIPQRPHAGGLDNKGAVQVQEDAANHQHLTAMVLPTGVHEAEENHGVRGSSVQTLEAQRDVLVAHLLELGVQVVSFFMNAKVLNSPVEFLETARHRLLRLHCGNSILQFRPGDLLKVLWKLWFFFEGLDNQLLRRSTYAAASGRGA